MKISINFFEKNRLIKTNLRNLFTIVVLHLFLGTVYINAQETTNQFIKGTDTLVVYSDVPGLAPSEFYTIKVRSATTNNEWKDCYANITRSLWSTLPANAPGTNNSKEHYYDYVKDWSHTYSNIEMSKGGLVEVRISAKNGFKIRGANFNRANAHPVQKASKPTVVNNIVYFSITNPGQITIDINGQMDEVNTGNGYSGPAIHTVSLFANPVMKKPSLTDPDVYVVEPGIKPPSNLGAKTTMYFKPGVHDIGRAFPLVANQKYYIPGDAIVYGTLYNGNASGANIRVYGYGTLSGDRIKHPNYNSPKGDEKSYRLIGSVNSSNFIVEGIGLMNCPFHTVNLHKVNSNVKETFIRWVKVVTWRGNGDGIGNADEISDSFFRTQDDCTYVKGDRLRNVFWTDVNGSIFSMAGMHAATIKPTIVEDCDIIYARHCSTTWNGGRVFAKRGPQLGGSNASRNVNVIFRNIRITDPYQTLETFYISSNDHQGSSGAYSGITFQNITSVKVPAAGDNRIIGHVGGVWDNITFDNVVLGGKVIANTTDFAAMGPFVTNVKFSNTTSIPEIEGADHNLIIYPNPATEKLFINAKGTELNRIEMLDVTGKVVYSSKSVIKSEPVDILGLIGGLYFVKLHTSSGLFTSKFIKK